MKTNEQECKKWGTNLYSLLPYENKTMNSQNQGQLLIKRHKKKKKRQEKSKVNGNTTMKKDTERIKKLKSNKTNY